MKKVKLVALGIFLVTFSSCSKEETAESVTPEENSELVVTKAQASDPDLYVPGTANGNRKDQNNSNGRWSTIWLVEGQANMSFPTYQKFKMEWENTKNMVGGKGWFINNNGNSNYNIGKEIKYRLQGKSGTVDFAGVYGWTTNPPVEYYVVEKGNHFIGDGDYEETKTYWANGSQYKFYKKRMPKLPSAVCTDCYFWQYVSVRQNQPNWNMSGDKTINMSKHVNIWKNNGFTNWGANNRLGTPAAYQVFGTEVRSYGNPTSGNLTAIIR